jgi:tRNA(Ile2) C34 agmatinyltransferase TiaS
MTETLEAVPCPYCASPTRPNGRPGDWWCEACGEVVIHYNVVPVWPDPDQARYPSLDAAVEAAMPHLAKLAATQIADLKEKVT